MTEIIIPLTDRVTIDPDRQIKEVQLPVVPAEKIAGVLKPAQIPLLPSTKISGIFSADQLPAGLVQTTDLNAAITLHEQESDPHPQYATDSDLTDHAGDQALHIPTTGISNSQIASNAAIEWSKISKSGSGLHTTGSTPPSSPSIGDKWRETIGALSRYGWDWEWTGSVWRSPEFRSMNYGAFSATQIIRFAVDQIFNVIPTFAEFEAIVASANDSSNYWTFRVEHRNPTDISTEITLASIDTRTTANGVVLTGRFTLGDLIAVGATGAKTLAFRAGKVLNPGTLTISVLMGYHLTRL